MQQIEYEILRFVQDVYNAVGWPGVVIMMAIESACIPLPSEIVMPLAGWMLVKAKGLEVSLTLLAGFYGALGNVLGSALAYWVGRWGGRRAIERYGRYVLISQHDLATADRWFARYGNWAVFFSRMLPVVRTFISFPAGVARANFGWFLVLSFAGSLPWSWGLAYAGFVLGEHWEEIRTVMRPFDIPIILVLFALVCLYIYRHVRRGNTAPVD
ncbi:MAG: DedA family protein [Chloroflexi bacterium]|nr:DedA family protein [Chloroflexota bacterium]